MNLKRILALTLLFILLTAVCSCGEKGTGAPRPSYDSEGVYAGFSDIPENYNADMAIKDGCVVISHYTVSDTQPNVNTGYEHFEKFIQEAEQKKNATLQKMVLHADMSGNDDKESDLDIFASVMRDFM